MDACQLQLDDFLGKTPIEYQSDLILISFPYDHLDIETNYEWLKFTKMNSLISSSSFLENSVMTQQSSMSKSNKELNKEEFKAANIVAFILTTSPF